MKTINNIYEASILADIDNQITNGDAAMEQHRKEELEQLFTFKYGKGISLVFPMTTRDVMQKRKLFIEHCCSLDSDNVLTIDFTKIKTEKRLNSLKNCMPSITIYNNVDSVERIKIIDWSEKRDDVNASHALLNALIIANDTFDLNKIDKTSNVGTVVFKPITDKSTFIFKDNIIPFTVNSLVTYRRITGFNKIYKNKWPKCKIEFDKFSWMNLINNEVFGNKNIEMDYPSQHLSIN